LPAQCGTHEQAIDLHLALRTALFPLGDFRRILTVLREAEALAVALDDPHRLGQVSLSLSNHFYMMAAYDQASAAAQRALALATAKGESVLQARVNQFLGVAYQAQGDYRRAIDCFGQTMAAFNEAQHHERFGEVFPPPVVSRAWLTMCHAELGTFVEGRALGAEGLRIAEAIAHLPSIMFASWALGLLSLRQGNLSRAILLLERAASICHADLPLYFPRVTAHLGAAYTLGGRVADALSLLTQAMEQTMAMGLEGFQVLCRLTLGEAQMLTGRLQDTHALAEETLALARAHRERGNETYTLRLLGEIVARCNAPAVEQTAVLYQQALILAEEIGIRPLQAHCHLGLGAWYRQRGQRQQAYTALTIAIDLYRTMDMTFWLPQAEAALA
jgi:tetratricopeptide (TPR) repeat protein